MKHLTLTILILFCFSCSNKQTSADRPIIENNDSSFAGKLIAADYLLYADSLKIDTLRDQIIKSFDIYDDRNNRVVYVDAEELAELQFWLFVPDLNKILNKRKFLLDIKTLDNYEILMNGEKIQLYTQDQIENPDLWNMASRKFFRKLNDLLKKQGIKESFFLLYSDNDLFTLLLTEEQFRIISDKYKNEPKEIPYRP